ncbi:F-box protein family-like [Rhynchospora pubera]|uniref:F-box protein family-like n=1 Tax=Rhynchospora pubera TaxID=906938 RepID=A0AAV8DUZ7_9POAL|nr:F-box protein family-like [Rhynchospora pubera]
MAMADGADLFLSLPDDAFSLIAAHLGHPRHLLALSLSSRRLYQPLLSSPSAWLSLASSNTSSISPSHLHSWHSLASLSYPSLCRFLFTVSRLLSLWAHQNPELGNLVFPIWGFVSLVFVRIIPQEVSKNLAFSPVMEIHCDVDGAPSLFFLHGEAGTIHAGSIFSVIPSDPTVLLLEANFSRNSSLNPSLFSKLAFGDRRRLLDFLSSKSAMKLPSELESAPIFPRSDDDFDILSRRREALISMYKAIRGGVIDCAIVESSQCCSSLSHNRSFDGDGKRKKLSSYVKDGIKQLIGRSISSSSNTNGENKHLPLHEFLKTGSGDFIGLSIRAIHTRLTSYRAWPNMHENRFALYKLHLNGPEPNREFSGLWGGSFGWPPSLPGQDKPGKALFLLLLSYEESDKGLILVGTKVLEGTHYVLHPNGSSMFIANMEEPSTDVFPWEMEISVNCGFTGEGISSGYGFRYPGSKPGSLFSLRNGLLAFVWRESKAVLTLERIDLSEMVAKGEQVPALPAVSNFTYLTKSYSNVFMGFQSNLSGTSSPR